MLLFLLKVAYLSLHWGQLSESPYDNPLFVVCILLGMLVLKLPNSDHRELTGGGGGGGDGDTPGDIDLDGGEWASTSMTMPSSPLKSLPPRTSVLSPTFPDTNMRADTHNGTNTDNEITPGWLIRAHLNIQLKLPQFTSQYGMNHFQRKETNGGCTRSLHVADKNAHSWTHKNLKGKEKTYASVTRRYWAGVNQQVRGRKATGTLAVFYFLEGETTFSGQSLSCETSQLIFPTN